MTNLKTNVTAAWESTLSASLASGATTISVTDTTGAPAVPFYAVIEPDNDAKRETVLVDSAKTSTTFVLTSATKRGLDGSTDTSHEPNVRIAVVPTAANINDLHDRIDAIGTPYAPGGTDVAVADGGTGASTAAAARTNLGAAADADVVKLTGDQTVAGVKTFSSSPIVPAPTTDLQASTKKYVDDAIGSATSAAGCRAWLNTTTSIPNSTSTAIPLDRESFDTDAFRDDAVNPTRLTVPAGKGGLYVVTAGIVYAANGTGVRRILVYVNGTPASIQTVLAHGTDSNYVLLADVLNLAAGDYVELFATQTSGGALNAVGSEESTFLALAYQGPV